jgi:hypothetical protein
MELEIIMLREMIQTQKDKYCMFSLIYGVQMFKKKTWSRKGTVGGKQDWRGRKGDMRAMIGRLSMIELYLYENVIMTPIILYN